MAQGELENVVVALISRNSISTDRSGLSKENNRDESQEALREREVQLPRLPFVCRSRVPGKRRVGRVESHSRVVQRLGAAGAIAWLQRPQEQGCSM